MYTIAAKPTLYNGRQYRSRLEAKWATFFDMLGWRFEYEPFDLGVWSPDFILIGNTRNVLVEVKPITQVDDAVCCKMMRGTVDAGRNEELLLVGVAPDFSVSIQPWNGPKLGWMGEWTKGDCSDSLWEGACIGALDKGFPSTIYDFSHEYGSFFGRMTDCGYREAHSPSHTSLMEMWAKASNSVQYHPV